MCFSYGRFVLKNGIQYSFIDFNLNVELQALSVFFLYVRCTAIDPADQGVMVDCDKTSKNRSKLDEELAGWTLNATDIY